MMFWSNWRGLPEVAVGETRISLSGGSGSGLAVCCQNRCVVVEVAADAGTLASSNAGPLGAIDVSFR